MKTFGWFTRIFVPYLSLKSNETTKLLPFTCNAFFSSRRFLAALCWLQIWRRRRKYYDSSLIFLIFFYALTVLSLSKANSSGFSNSRHAITTPFGVVRGETILPASEDDLPAVTQYLGIPYGVAPSGQYRFNMAISAPKWTHQPKSVVKFSPVCIQSGLPQLSETEALKTMSSNRFDEIHRIFPFLKPESEDCLYMNLYIPERPGAHRDALAGDLNGQNQLSVLVLVHGDDYGWGAGNAYNASILAAYTQTVVVTLNYRLGVYGFLGRCESNSCTGNAGLSDLVVALKMLSNILPSFGADPSSLTLLGWGSGAALVSLLMASPITLPKNRLFRRAVLLDGSALCPWAMVDNPQQYLLKIAMELQCISEDKKNSNTNSHQHHTHHSHHRLEDAFQKQVSQVIRCLQNHGHQNLTAAARRVDVPTFTSAFAPIVDGQIVPNHPKYSFSAKYGALFRDIDLMIGTVANPAHHLLPNADLESGVDLERRDKFFRTLVRNLFNFHRKEIFDALTNEYTDWDNPKNHPKTLRGNVLSALNDVLFTAPLIRTARMHSTDEVSKTSNTFMFVFAHESERSWSAQSSAQKNSAHGIRGSLSEDYLPYILGYPLSSVRQRDSRDYGRFTSDDKGISRVLMQYISNFVKSGDPTKPQSIVTRTAVEERFFGTPWPQYSPATREAYLELNDRPRVKNYYRNAYVGFWNSFIPQLNLDNRESGVSEEHNFLTDHFKKGTFFGTVRRYASFHNDPFPPPPMPPTPFPIESLKKSTVVSQQSVTSTSKPGDGDASKDAKSGEAGVRKAENYNLVITVAVGVGFLVLNMCIYVLMIRKCFEGKRKSKKRLKYQSYTVGHPSTSEINFAPNSTLAQFPPLNSAAVLSEVSLKTDGLKSNENMAVAISSGSGAASGVATLRNGGIDLSSSRHMSHVHAVEPLDSNNMSGGFGKLAGNNATHENGGAKNSNLMIMNADSTAMISSASRRTSSNAPTVIIDHSNAYQMSSSYTNNNNNNSFNSTNNNAMSSSMYSSSGKYANDKNNSNNNQVTRPGYHLLANITAGTSGKNENGFSEITTMSTVPSLAFGGITTSTRRRMSLREREQVLNGFFLNKNKLYFFLQ